MKDVITITRHQLARKCNEALHYLFEDEAGLSESFMKALLLSGLIVAKCFEEEEQDDEENVSVNN